MECYLITQGHSLESIRALPTSYLLDITYLFQKGIVGWQADARVAYATYAQNHNQQQLHIATNSKNYKPKKPPKFEAIFPTHHELMHLGIPPEKKLENSWLKAMESLRKM